MNEDNKRNVLVVDNDHDPLCNHSDNPSFESVLNARLSRRDVLRGSVSAALVSMFGLSVAACDSSSSSEDTPAAPLLGFAAIALNRDDTHTLPAGYVGKPLVPWGTPIVPNASGVYPAFKDDGTNSGEDQECQVGSHHDGIHFFPIDYKAGGSSSSHGLLCINHEYFDPNVFHANGPTVVDKTRPVADEVRKEVAGHGVSVVEIQKNAQGEWGVVLGGYNRRITGATPMEIRGPVRGSDLVKTKYSPNGTMTRGTLNNCGNGYTPWGTYLTCEENWAGYFINDDAQRPREHTRFGVSTSANHGRYFWHTVTDHDVYARFNASSLGASALEDYRNEPNGQGWIVEIDPWNPASIPVKRTALGRFAHEGAIFAPPIEGKPIVFYSGDDARNEYIYKYVSAQPYHKASANGALLDTGTLYVAKFNDDGTGQWLALDINDAAFQAAMSAKGVSFADQADVLVNTRLAADVAGATKMDRPEWGAVHPETGEVYFTLTNNTNRTADQVDAANPRPNNATGHIIRWRESNGDAAATTFGWDIFVLAGDVGNSQVLPAQNGPALDASNIFASPDGLWIDPRGVLWIQTDMSGSQQASGPFGNNQMLGADPVTGDIRRFCVGPVDQEVTGVITTPDMKTMFINFQHPGDRSTPGNFTSHWPGGGNSRPRSGTLVITRADGGVVGA